MYVIDKASHDGTELCIFGWCFKPSTTLQGAIAEIGDQRIELEGFGLKSDDVAQHYGEEARNARFQFRIKTPQRACVIAFNFADGSAARAQIATHSREPGYLRTRHLDGNKKQTPSLIQEQRN